MQLGWHAGYLYSLCDRVLGRVTGHIVMAWVMRQGYLFTSYVSTSAMKPSGKAMANEINAANSPSLASVPTTLNRSTRRARHVVDASSKSTSSPPPLCINVCVRNSLRPVNEVMYACAWVPFTGMLNSLPARTLLVPSKPPTINNSLVYERGFYVLCCGKVKQVKRSSTIDLDMPIVSVPGTDLARL